MDKEIAKKTKTASERYSDMVMKEFSALSGEVVIFDQNQKRLAQHLFVKADASLKTLEAKRVADSSKQSMLAYTWQNVNLTKLAVDSVHRIEIGLDALIPNHLSMIPYWNKHLQKYDLDLQIGYVGRDYYRRKMAYNAPVDIIYELVFDTDVFEPIKKSQGIDVESYKFEIKNPFRRGAVIGGFGYIVYEDPKMNKLVIVTEAEFKESEALSKGGFWKKSPKAMRYKTIVNRATDKLLIDPDKTNVSFFEVEQQENSDEFEKEEEDQIIDIDPDEVKETTSGNDQALKESQAKVVDIDPGSIKIPADPIEDEFSQVKKAAQEDKQQSLKPDF